MEFQLFIALNFAVFIRIMKPNNLLEATKYLAVLRN